MSSDDHFIKYLSLMASEDNSTNNVFSVSKTAALKVDNEKETASQISVRLGRHDKFNKLTKCSNYKQESLIETFSNCSRTQEKERHIQ